MRNSILLSALFFHTLAGAFLCFVADRVYGLWTGGFGLWPVVLPALAAGWLVGWAIRRWAERRVGARVLALPALVAALLAAFVFLDHAGLAHGWTFTSLHMGLTYEAWRGFVWGQAALWFAPLAFLLPLLWVRGNAIAPRGRMTVFVGVCVGFILGRIFAGALPFPWVWAGCVAVLLLSAGVWLAAAFERLWVRAALAAVAVLLLCGAGLYAHSCRLEEGKRLEALNPFAAIAARDVGYTGEGAEGFTLLDGRVVRAEGMDTASQVASQLIPSLLKPADNARIAVRPVAGAPALPTYEAGQLKGLYDAIWVELPPAWMPAEQDYFGAAALDACLSHLKDDGLLVYDLDARALGARMLMERVLILRRHFAHVQLWMTGLNAWQLVACRQPIATDLDALNALADRSAVADCLRAVNVTAPLYLLPCCMVADAQTLESALQEGDDAVEADLSWGESTEARKRLFDRQNAARLLAAFAPFYDAEMPWVSVPAVAEKDFRDLFVALRAVRKDAMLDEKKQSEAGRVNPSDPFLQGLADRYVSMAESLSKLANTDRALQFYNFAFALANPDPEDILAAAELAKSTGDLLRAEAYYRLAAGGRSGDFAALSEYAQFLKDRGYPEEAERHATQALRLILDGDPAVQRRLRFFIAACVAGQKDRADEGLALARRVAETAPDRAERDLYVPAYGQLLIDCGRAKEGIAVKRHYKAYGELLSPEEGSTP